MNKLKIAIALCLPITGLLSCGNNVYIPGGLTPEQAKELVVSCKTKNLATSYQYDYTISTSLQFPGGLSFNPGSISGTTQYCDGQFLQKRETRGLFLPDSISYTFNKDDDVIKLNNRYDDFEVVNKEKNPSYDFESNSIGKIFKSLAKDDIIDIRGDNSNDHKFIVGLGHTTFSNKFLSCLNYIDLTIVFNALNSIAQDKWGLNFKPTCYFILDSTDTYVSEFHFDLNMNIKDIINVNFALGQTFSKIGQAIDIAIPPYFEDEGCYIDDAKIDAQLTDLKDNYLQDACNHYYRYKLKTKVDHGVSKDNIFGIAYNSTIQGYSERSNKFFHNKVEVDVDNKYEDEFDIMDYTYVRARVDKSDCPVYDVEDGILTKRKEYLIDGYNNDEIDKQYMMIKSDWLNSAYIKALKKTQKNDECEWKLGLSNEAIKMILEWYNKAIRLDKDLSRHINVYEIEKNFTAKNCKFIITTNDSNSSKTIKSISIDMKGLYTVSEAKDDDVTFGFELDIYDFDYNKSYNPPTKPDDIEY